MQSESLLVTIVGGLLFASALALAGCGGGDSNTVSCGPGTVLQGDQCVLGEGAPVCEDGAQQACYVGPEDTLDVGACQAGTQLCAGGAWGACIGAVLPEPETCDGVDGDCNGVVDDGLGTLSCGAGECAQTTPACVAGEVQTCKPGTPGPEECDGLDNDCDGDVDEGNPDANEDCSTGLLGMCASGTTACVAGTLTCDQTVSSGPESCNGLDDDCDGDVDEDSAGTGQACDTGKLGVCAAGKTACEDGMLICGQSVGVGPESCNGLDDDCDGTVDDGNPGANQDCSTGLTGVCASGTTACVAGALTCNQTTEPSPESCNGLDDDCDGIVDENSAGTGQACSTGDLGVCAAGKTACVSGALSCSPSVAAGPESCNGLDDDCDGDVDEGNPGGNQVCTTGMAGPCATGKTACVSGSLVCTATPPPAPEQCNGIDDDCDGVVDDSIFVGTSCGTGLPGPCAAGLMECAGGQLTCTPNVPPSAEICDGWDNDCDGIADEGCPAACDPPGLTAGQMTLGPSAALVALCGGEVLVGHMLLNRVERHDVVTKTLVASYQLNTTPGDIVYDASANVAYVALALQPQIARINLATGAIVTIPVGAPARRLALGDDGVVFVSHSNYTLSLVDGPAAMLLTIKSLPVGYIGDLVAYDGPSEHLFLGNDGGTTLSRYHFDAATLTLTALQTKSAALGNCKQVATSPFGGHVAYACPSGNGSTSTYELFDYSPYDLAVISGSWNVGPYPVGAAFSADGTMLLASNTSALRLFDATTHALIQTWAPQVCQYGTINRVAMSPGGAIAYGYSICGFNKDYGMLHWYIP